MYCSKSPVMINPTHSAILTQWSAMRSTYLIIIKVIQIGFDMQRIFPHISAEFVFHSLKQIVNFTFLIEQHIELYQTCQYLRKNYHYSDFSKSAEDSLAGADLTNDRRIS